MELTFNTKLAEKYSNASQKMRVLTEDWVDNSNGLGIIHTT